VTAPAPADRMVGLLVLGVAAVLLVSSPTWFAGGQPWVGVAQLLLALVAVGVGAWLLRRAARRG
jgi:CHASE2 domain-containing sensor protein